MGKRRREDSPPGHSRERPTVGCLSHGNHSAVFSRPRKQLVDRSNTFHTPVGECVTYRMRKAISDHVELGNETRRNTR